MTTDSSKPANPADSLRKAAATIQTLKARLARLETRDREPIAIVGMACRFPGGVDTPDALWELLQAGTDTVGEIPSDRWDIDDFYDPDPEAPGKMSTRAGAFVRDHDRFDPGFFGITPREAKALDPQHRLLLEVSWQALEDAGVVPSDLVDTRTGVFVGIGESDYGQLSTNLDAVSAYTGLGTASAFSAGRLSYVLGLQGPSLALDTACSSSLVALHLGCMSLRAGESQVALVGGVSLIISPLSYVFLSRSRALSPDGRCKTFSAKADGYGRGEGCAMLVLKRLADAQAAGDRIWGVVRGSAVAHDGASSGLTAPNGTSQQLVLREALRAADLAGDDIDYIEAHGTGTPLGDPIEVEALAAVYGARQEPLRIGSIKTNLGHLETASGVAGVMKAVLAIHHGELPAHLHADELNPHIPWAELPIRVTTHAEPWPRSGAPRRAGISSFGMSGTNAHVILEQAPSPPPAAAAFASTRPAELLTVSARTADSLREQARRLAEHLRAHPSLELPAIAHALATRRTHLPQRLAARVADRDAALAVLDAAAAGTPEPGTITGRISQSAPRQAWLFTGQGSQHAGMGRALDAHEPVFRAAIDRAAAVLDGVLEVPLRAVLFPAAGAASPIDQTAYTQPALFALEVALAELWRSWGMRPAVVIGHSVGEYAAACVAGVFSLEDGLRLIAARGRLMQALTEPGAMVAIAAPEARVVAAVAPHAATVSIAAVNGPEAIVISGAEADVLAIAGRFATEGVRTRRLTVSHAFHSPLMTPMLAEFRHLAESISYARPRLPLVGNLDGRLVGDAVTRADYWVRHISEPVRFADGVDTLLAQGITIGLEIGPQPVLVGLAAACASAADVTWLPSLRPDRDPHETVLDTAARLHVAGATVDGCGMGGARTAAAIPLPTYAFARERYWLDAPATVGGHTPTASDALAGPAGSFQLSGRPLPVPGDELHQVILLGVRYQPYLADHVVHGQLVVAGAIHLAIVLAVAFDRLGAQQVTLSEVQFVRPLFIPDEARVHVVLRPDPESGRHRFTVATAAGDDDEAATTTWHVHCEGWLATTVAPPSLGRTLDDARAANTTPVSVQAVYDQIAAFSMIWGPSWQGLNAAFASASSALVQLARPADGDAPQGPLHPRLIDNGIGSASAVAVAHADAIGQEHDAPLPYALGALRLYRPPTGPLWCLNQARTLIDAASEAVVGDLVFWDEHGDVVVEIEAFASKRGRKDAFLSLSEATGRLPFHTLAWQPLPPVAPAPLTGRWAVMGADATVVDALASALAHAGADVVAEPTGTLAGVVCWWDASSSGGERATADALAGLRQVQALARLAPAPRLVWATTGATSVDGAPARALSTSTLWGLGRAVASEHPELRLRLVEIAPGLAPEAAARAIAAELSAADDETQVALGETERVGARLARMPAISAVDAPFVSDGGTVLITGGLGGMGLALAHGLVTSAGVRHLVLVGRRAATAASAAIIDELRAHGATVEVASADVADRDALAAVLAAIPDAHPLRAVVHAAGVLDDGVLAQQTAERFERVFAPKVAGAWHLHELTAGITLERFVLCSSATTFLGAAGQSNYAAANAFLDALAAHRRVAGLPATSIAWGPWTEVGMASNMGAPERARLSRLGLGWIEPAQGVVYLRAAVEQPAALVGVLPLDLAKLRRAFAHSEAPSILRVLVGERTRRGAEAQALETRLRGLPPRARARTLQDVLRADLRTVMGVIDVATDQPLRELGLDSLMAVELRNGLAAKLGRPLPATLLYDHPTLEALATYLLEHVLDIDGDGAPAAAISAPVPLAASEPIAIIGMACRYPGGVIDPESFWSLLERGGDAITEIPPDRWDVDALYDPDPDAPGKMWNREGGFIADVDKFDADFFGISAREAVDMDPQQRLLLEVSWEAVERAGIAPSALMGRSVGVFVGAMSFDYAHIRENRLDALTGYVITGNGGSIAAGRISYTLGVKGPCVTIDTACSSSLVTLHYACQSLRLGECETALAGGVTLTLTPAMHVEFSRLRVSSPEGRCKSFGASANGAGWSEGCGMVLLKPLAAARRDGDPILAVIRGSAVNQDGRSQGLTAPNGPAQEAVISRALAVAGVAPAEIDYVECHGTGTPLGDPIEVQALGAVLARGRTSPAVIGSVKSNIGHAQAAAGIAGVIKTVLSMQHELIPPSLHAETLSPHVPWAQLPLQVATTAMPWHRNGRPRRAGVSSFGISGTNAHVVLEEAPAPPVSSPAAPVDVPASHLLCLSARAADALRGQAARLADHLRAHPDVALADVAHALGSDRSHFAHRLVVRAADRDTALAGLDAHAAGATAPVAITGQARGRAPRVAFCYTGQGSQYAPLARRLYQSEPVFRAALDRCAAVLDRELALPLAEVLWPSADGAGAGAIDRTAYTQPALFAIGHALTALWRSWGIEPAAVIGHSVGEYVAACAAGVFSLADGLRLIAARGRLMDALSADGAMLSITADEARVAVAVARYTATVSIAAVNAGDQIVIAGAAADVLALADELAAEGVRTRRLTVSHAFHSPLMEPMLDDFRRVVASIELSPPQLPLISNLHGGLAGDELADPDYWVRHVREPVRFADGIATLGRQDLDAVIELGPRPTLIAMAAAALPDAPIAWLPSLRPDHDDVEIAHDSLARLYVAGADLDWNGVSAGRATRKVALPTYAFARRRHWLARTVLDEFREHARDGAIERNLYALRWRELPANRDRGDVTGHWIVCLDEGEVGATLADALEQAGARVTRLAIDADDAAAVAAGLTPILAADGTDVRGVVCAWTLVDGWAGGAPRGLTRALHALQATVAAESPARIVVLTRGAVATTDDELVDPAQAALWGLGRVAALEHAARWGGLVDLPAGSLDERHLPALLAAVAAGVAGDPEDQRALRGGGAVRVPRLVPITVPSVTAPWTARDTVLVTGGLGALGRRVATWAVERGAAHVVLTSRRGAATEGAAEAAARLEALGARVSIVAADSGDRDAMAALIAGLDADACPLRAVFHTAGVADDAAVRELDDAELARVFAGKARGAELLDELLGDRELDAFVAFASIAGVWGSARQASYAAANAYLDGLGARRRRAGRVATTIDFGPWSGDGMAAEIAGLLRRRGLEPLDAATMLGALERLLATRTATAVVAGVDWERFRSLYELERARPMMAELPGAPSTAAAQDAFAPAASALLRTLRTLDAVNRRAHIQGWLRDVVAAVLGRTDSDGVDVRTGFFDLGLDSLMALELRRRVQAELGLTLSATAAFNHPNVEALAGHLLDQLGLVLDGDGAGVSGVAAPAAPAWNEPIAIVGIGCRMPGAGDGVTAFWQLLDSERDAAREVPADRWDIDAYYDPDPRAEGKTYVRRGAFIEGHDRFDAEFFGIAPRDAAAMDPQHRLLLETAWAALEDAGVVPGHLAESRTGIFVGIGESEYMHVLPRELEAVSAYTGTGTSPSFSAGRLSYVLGLQGPSMAVDTACSSSLVALHLACQSLRAGESQLALAGGVSLMLSPEGLVFRARIGALSPDGRCKTFAADADGYVRGEGCGVLVLKRLSDARAAGDRVWAVVRGSAVAHDGASSGLTVPNGRSQEQVLRDALASAGVRSDEVDYVEAHGTGTPLGDPIEVEALAAVYGRERGAAPPLRIGSVKTNVGHLEAAAGVAGLIKTVLALHHERIPRHLHVEHLSPHIPWATIPVEVATTATPWPVSARPRRAGVSAFGLSGTNAHVVLEEAPPPDAPPADAPSTPVLDERSVHLFVLSARSPAALGELAGRVALHLGAHPESSPGDVAHALGTRREQMPHRLALVAADSAAAANTLAAFAADGRAANVVTGRATRAPRVAFLYPGQGAQFAQMARQLHATEPVFRDVIERCSAALTNELERPLAEVLWPSGDGAGAIDRTAYTQPALFAVQVALSALWRSWGIEPAMLIGHSAGEYAAACVAGVFSVEDGARLMAARGRLMDGVPEDGAMVSVVATEADVTARLAPFAPLVSIAAINGPESVVIGGPERAVAIAAAAFEAAGLRIKRLRISTAPHTVLMDPMLDGLAGVLASATFHPALLPCVSCVDGALAGARMSDPAYWIRHVREPVRFADGVATLAGAGIDACLEISPRPTLLGTAASVVPGAPIAWLPSLVPARGDHEATLDALARLHVTGASIDWAGLDGGRPRRAVELPSYPFARTRHWVERSAARPTARATAGGHALLGAPLRLSIARGPRIWEQPLVVADGAGETAAVPAARALELSLALAAEHLGAGAVIALHGVALDEHAGDAAAPRTLQSALAHDGQGTSTFSLASAVTDDVGDAWHVHAHGAIASGTLPAAPAEPRAAVIARCPQRASGDDFYRRLARGWVETAPEHRMMQATWSGDHELGAELAIAASADATTRRRLALEAAMQLVHRVAGGEDVTTAIELAAAGTLVVAPALPATMWAHAVIRGDGDQRVVDVTLHAAESDGADGADGAVVLALRDVALRPRAVAGTSVQSVHARLVTDGHPTVVAQLGAQLADVLGNVLAVDPAALDPDGAWKTYGLDSLMELEVIRRMERKVGVSLRLTQLPGDEAAPAPADADAAPRTLRSEAVRIAGLLDVAGRAMAAVEPTEPDALVERVVALAWDDEVPTGYRDAFGLPPSARSCLATLASGITLDVYTVGAGRPVVLLPPIISSALIWKYQIEALAAHHRVIIPNYPGWGRSSFRPRDIAPERLASQLLAVLDALGVDEPAHLVGWSLGGMVAQLVARHSPARVRSLSLVNTTARLDEVDTIENAQRMLRELKADIDLGLADLPAHQADDVRRLILAASASSDRTVDMYYLGAVLRFDSRTILGGIRTPTLVVQGRRDPIATREVGDFLHRQIPGACYVESDAGHYVPLHDPDHLNRRLLDFLGEPAASPA